MPRPPSRASSSRAPTPSSIPTRPSNKPVAAVVFRTAHQLPRRYDGLIRAGGTLGANGGGGSIASVRGAHGKASHCYTFLAPMKDGRLRSPARGSVRRGSRHTLTITARGTHGDVKDTIRLTFKKKAAGDRSGKPLGC